MEETLGKYEKLTSFLDVLRTSSRRMGFTEIEEVLGFTLPASARTYQAWWANNPIDGRQSSAWLSAGWQTEDLDLPGEAVTFRRGQATSKGISPRAAKPDRTARRPARNGIPENLPDAPDGTIQLTMAMNWKCLGAVCVDEAGKLSFPDAPTVPALYRLRLSSAEGARHYIGEAVNLRRRFGNYRNPGPTQATSIRINDVLRTHLAAGGQAEVDLVASGMTLSISGQEVTVELAHKATRRLLEQAAIVACHAIDIESLNR